MRGFLVVLIAQRALAYVASHWRLRHVAQRKTCEAGKNTNSTSTIQSHSDGEVSQE